ncbi:MAG: helix-turn-helix domain-containing protein [Rhizobiales bacterium]|nr:helix-turn-helix domain-containing protein [Hyphomicrobiales bacterium]
MASTAPEFATLRFATGNLPPQDRVPLVREALGRKSIGLDMEPLPDQPFRMDAVQHVLPGLTVGSVVNSGIRVARTRALVTDGDDSVTLAVLVAGAEIFSQLGREVTVADGEAVLLSNADIYEGISPAGKRFLGVWLPRTALAALVPNLEDAFARAIPRDSAALRLLTGYLDMLRHNDALAAPDLQRLIVTHVYDLIALTVGASRDAVVVARERGLRAARLSAVKADIAAHLRDGGLSVVAVAARQQVTPRYVQMLFEREGTTFSQYVLGERLARAHRMLSDRRRAGSTITAIAFEAGFGDLSYFNRAFRRAYGATPSDVRSVFLGA